MRSFRFLLSRRWVLFAVAVVVLVYATWWLGNWQFGRLESKRHDNGIIRTNEHAKPVPAADLLGVGKVVDQQHEWRRVTATGTYDTAHTIIWRYRSGDHSQNGIDVVVPLVTQDGTAVLVDRGWMATADQDHPDTPPAAPTGTVTVTGWARADATGSAIGVMPFGHMLGTRALSSTTAGPATGHRTYGGFVDVETEHPAPATSLEQVALPELNDGPHFFYGIQWWFFGILAVVGFFYLLYDERRVQRTSTEPDGATEAEIAETDAQPADEPQPSLVPAAPAPAQPDLRAERKARKAAKNARKQAVRAAYHAAYAQEKDKRQSERSMPPSTGTIAPVTNDDAGESRKVATRPNSAGRP